MSPIPNFKCPLLAIPEPSNEESSYPVISPLTPKLVPTFRAQNMSPFWLTGTNTTFPLAQVLRSLVNYRYSII